MSRAEILPGEINRMTPQRFAIPRNVYEPPTISRPSSDCLAAPFTYAYAEATFPYAHSVSGWIIPDRKPGGDLQLVWGAMGCASMAICEGGSSRGRRPRRRTSRRSASRGGVQSATGTSIRRTARRRRAGAWEFKRSSSIRNGPGGNSSRRWSRGSTVLRWVVGEFTDPLSSRAALKTDDLKLT